MIGATSNGEVHHDGPEAHRAPDCPGTEPRGNGPGKGEDHLSGAEALRVVGVKKAFGSVRALVGVDMSVNHGEVVALVGDNGAGKSTLVKIISGVIPRDEGELYMHGVRASVHSPNDAARLGIRTIHQDLGLAKCARQAETGPVADRLQHVEGPHTLTERVRRAVRRADPTLELLEESLLKFFVSHRTSSRAARSRRIE